MDVEFGGDMLAVRDDRVHRDTEHVGYLLVTQPAHHLNKHIAFPLTQLSALSQRPVLLLLSIAFTR